jgi:hypothetical protein
LDVVATPGDPTANSYVDADYMDLYCEARLASTAWTDQDDEDLKSASLIQSTRVLDSLYDWNGWQSTSDQALRWPRDGAINYDQAFGPNSMYDFDSTLTAYFDRTIVPKQIKDATCELAIFLLEQGKYTGDVNDLSLVKVGPLRVDFRTTNADFPVPNPVIDMLRHMGTYTGQSGGNTMKTATLVRT